MRRYTARLHAALLRPRAAAEALCRGGAGGLGDAAPLLALRLLASEGQVLVRGALRVPLEGAGALGAALLQAASALVPDLLLMAGGAVLLGVLLRGGERLLRPGLTVDLAAQAWVAWVAVHALAALGFTLLQRAPGEGTRTAVQVLALGAFARAWGYAFAAAREAARRAEAAGTPDA
jgi:hypothetical protein